MQRTINPQNVSAIIPVYRRPVIRHTLLRNWEIFSSCKEVIVVVFCEDDLKLVKQSCSRYDNLKTRLCRASFNKSLALNLGAAGAAGEALLFVDCDVVLERHFLRDALKRLVGNKFVTLAAVCESRLKRGNALAKVTAKYSLELVVNKRRIDICTNVVRPLAGVRSGPGIILLRRTQFVRVGGMNAKLKHWGWEDLDLIARLQFKRYTRCEYGNGLHISHTRSADVYSESTNFLRCLANYAAGDFEGTLRLDEAIVDSDLT